MLFVTALVVALTHSMLCIAGAAEVTPPSLAILPFNVDSSVAGEQAGFDVAQSLVTQAASNKKHPWAVTDLEKVREAMNAEEFRGQAVDENFAVSIGRKLKAKFVIFGSLGLTTFTPSHILYGRRVDTERLTVVERETVEFDDLSALKTKVEALAYKLSLRRDKPDPIPTGNFDVADLLNSLQPPPPPPPMRVIVQTVGSAVVAPTTVPSTLPVGSNGLVATAQPATVGGVAADPSSGDGSAPAAQKPPLAVTLDVDGGVPSRAGNIVYQQIFRDGQAIRFRVTANRHCYLTLIFQEPESQEVYVLLPLPNSTEPVEVSPDSPAVFPPEGVRFLAGGPPFGPHVVKLLATSEPISIDALHAAGLKSGKVRMQEKGLRIGNHELPPAAAGLFQAVKELATAETVLMIVPNQPPNP
jgi:hypothetical protein